MRLPALWQKNVRSMYFAGDQDAIINRRHAVSRRRKERLETSQDVPLRKARGTYS